MDGNDTYNEQDYSQYPQGYDEQGAVQVEETPGMVNGQYDIIELLQVCYDRGASDIHIAIGRPPTYRIDGKLQSLDGPELTPGDTERLVKSVTPEVYLQKIAEVGSADFAYAFRDLARFRVSSFKQKNQFQLAMRMIPNSLMTWDQIGLPSSLKSILSSPRGIVLVTGPTGSGKSTTLASMIDIINDEFDHHIITIEDPIEFYHTHKTSIITQRELGVDTPTFAFALRAALRQDPDVMLVGEMRDLETIEAAITAAETGHLVFGTLHTNTAPGTINRIIDAFPVNQQEQIRSQLSVALVAVICQQLLPRARGTGRVAAFEILITTDAVRAMIRDRKIMNIVSAIQTGAKLGMQTLEQSLFTLYQRGLIEYKNAMDMASRPDELEKLIKGK